MKFARNVINMHLFIIQNSEEYRSDSVRTHTHTPKLEHKMWTDWVVAMNANGQTMQHNRELYDSLSGAHRKKFLMDLALLITRCKWL